MAFLDHAVRLWPELVARAPRKRTFTYTEAAEFLGHQNPRLIGRALDPIFRECLDRGWPIITALVVRKQTGQPGPGITPWVEDLSRELDLIATFPWTEVVPALPLTSVLDCQNDYAVEDTLALSRSRGAFQAKFRQDLLKIYRRRCALCDTRLADLLVASHIVPWSIDKENRLNPKNGILLCVTHDILFETGLVRVNPDLSVEIHRPRKTIGVDLEAILANTRTRLRKPSTAQPGRAFLAKRLTHFL